MRLLGIDYGAKRIGLAVSDENASIAFPKGIIPNDSKVFEKLGTVIREESISEMVVGESLNHEGGENMIQAKISAFVLELEKAFSLPVRMQKEFLTSVEARKPKDAKRDMHANQKGRMKQTIGQRVDSGAAALILQRYLDKKIKQNI